MSDESPLTPDEQKLREIFGEECDCPDCQTKRDNVALRAEVERLKAEVDEHIEQRTEMLLRYEKAEAEVERLRAELQRALDGCVFHDKRAHDLQAEIERLRAYLPLARAAGMWVGGAANHAIYAAWNNMTPEQRRALMEGK